MDANQGVRPREEFNEKEIDFLDNWGKKKFGDNYTFQGMVWHTDELSIIYLDFIDDNKEIKSAKIDLRKWPSSKTL